MNEISHQCRSIKFPLHMELFNIRWSRLTWAWSLLVERSFHFACFVVGARRIDGYRTVWIWLWDGHWTRTIYLVLIVFRATPKHTFFTFTISHITIVVQHQNGVSARRCLIRYIHITNYSRICKKKKDETNEIKTVLETVMIWWSRNSTRNMTIDWIIYLVYKNFYLGFFLTHEH